MLAIEMGLAAKDGAFAVQRAIEKALRDGELNPADLPAPAHPEPSQQPQPGLGRFAQAMHRVDDGDPLDAPCYVVAPFIHERTVSVLVGKWGMSKSFLVIDWCVRLAAGLPIAGVQPEVSGGTFYFAGEGQDALRKAVSCRATPPRASVATFPPLHSYTAGPLQRR